MSTHQLITVAPWVVAILVGWWGRCRVWSDKSEKAKGELIIFGLAFLFSFLGGYLFRWILAHREVTEISISFLVLLVLAEEFLKTWAVVKAVETGSRWIEETKDALMYALGGGLGFVAALVRFVGQSGFWNEYLDYWVSINLILLLIFGFYYAVAYQVSSKVVGSGEKKKQAPYRFLRNIMQAAVASSSYEYKQKVRTLGGDYQIMLKELFRVLTLHITRRHILGKCKTQGHWAGEVMLEGFLVVFYLHLLAFVVVLNFSGWLAGAFVSCLVLILVVLSLRTNLLKR